MKEYLISALISGSVGLAIFYWAKFRYVNIRLKLLESAFKIQFAKNSITETETVNNEFLKFVSESRDWAFAYIAEVQKELGVFQESTKDAVDRWAGDRNIIQSLADDDLRALCDAIVKLRKLLPEDGSK